MKSQIKSILLRWSFSHKIVDKAYDIICPLWSYVNLKIFRRHAKLQMRSAPEFKKGLCDLINDLPTGISMVEIGSYRGESAEIFLASGKVSKIYCIDPWQPFYDATDVASFTDMSSVERDFDERFKNEKRLSKEKGVIDDFVRKYPTMPKIDFVYIDGNHTEAATIHDIEITLNHIHPRFAIAGHDYSFPGVTTAVEKVFQKPDKVYIDTSWIKYQ